MAADPYADISGHQRARGQTLPEYSLLIAIVMAAILGLQVYAKRSIQAGIKTAADQIGSQDEGIAYEAGERRNRTSASAGRVLQQQSRVTSATDRNVRSRQLQGGGVQRDTVTDTSSTIGTLPSRGAGVASYSEVVAESQQ